MKSRHLTVLWAVSAIVAMLALTLASAAQAKTPAPGYEEFAGCPSPDEYPNLEVCLTSTITGGHFKMGNKNVPITNPITLSAGISEIDGSLHWNSKGGLLPAKQQVPGGIIGLTGLDWLVNFLNVEQLKLYAVTELAGQPGNPLIEDPFYLPIKVHLLNPALGTGCYVGSNANPIKLNLTTGTTSPPAPNEPISGKIPSLKLDPSREGVILSEDGVFVDNSFAAPGANGCRIELGLINIGIDGIVNATSGLPSAAGTNTTVQNFDGSIAFLPFVYP
jgi:hypothetical protein